MKVDTLRPFANLDPVLILDAIESVGFLCSGSLLALNSYENRVYQVGMDEGPPLIAKFYRPNRWSKETILEEHQFALELAQLEIPVVAPLVVNNQTLHHYQNYYFALFPRQGGRTFEPDNLNHLEWIGRFIGRIHAAGRCKSFQHRLRLNTHTYGHSAYEFLLQNNFIPDYLKNNFHQVMQEVLECVEDIFSAVGAINYIRLHGDFHVGNILWSDSGPRIVDLDDCLTGPAIQDLWMLISGNTEHDIEVQKNYLLRGYQEFSDLDFLELQLIEPLRTLRMINYSAWLAKRWDDPAFPLNFPWFNSKRYWEEQYDNLILQRDLMRS